MPIISISGEVFSSIYPLALTGIFFVFVDMFNYSQNLSYLFASYVVMVFNFILIFIYLFNKIFITKMKLKGLFSYIKDMIDKDFFKAFFSDVQDAWLVWIILMFFYILYLYSFLIYTVVSLQLLDSEDCENNMINSMFYSLLLSFFNFLMVSVMWKIFYD